MTEDKPLSERPLHIRVAEALGLGPRMVRVKGSDEFVAVWTQNAFYSDGAHDRETLLSVPVPRYDTSWEATGPLIEKYKMYLYWESAIKGPGGGWIAQPSDPSGATPFTLFGPGVTPLIAACNLILALAEAGKLEER